MINKQVLSGVACRAKECKYNHEGSKCYASSITVAGSTAHSTPETACETFECDNS